MSIYDRDYMKRKPEEDSYKPKKPSFNYKPKEKPTFMEDEDEDVEYDFPKKLPTIDGESFFLIWIGSNAFAFIIGGFELAVLSNLFFLVVCIYLGLHKKL